MRLLFFSILYIAIITAENGRCISSDISSDNSPIFTSRSYYDIGDTISGEDQTYPHEVCHSDGNYNIGSTFRFSDYSGDIILISMNATW